MKFSVTRVARIYFKHAPCAAAPQQRWGQSSETPHLLSGPICLIWTKSKVRESSSHTLFLLFFFCKRLKKFRVLQSENSPLVWISMGSFQPRVISSFSPQPWQVPHNKTEGNTESFVKGLTWAAATRSSKQTGPCTVPVFLFSTQKPQAQAGEVSCTAQHARGEHTAQVSAPDAPVTWAFDRGALRWTICYSLHVLFILYSESQYKGKSNPTKLGAMYGTCSYWNSSNKKNQQDTSWQISSQTQRGKWRNQSTRSN